MSSRTSVQPMKRKRGADNSTKSEPEAKKIRRIKSNKLEKDRSFGTSRNKRKSINDAGKLSSPVAENWFVQDQFHFKSGPEINNNVSSTNLIPTQNTKVELHSSTLSGFTGLSATIINSENFKVLRDVRVLLDRTVVDNYFRTRSLPIKLNQQNRPKRRVRRSKKFDSMENHGQKTLLDFYNFDAVSSKNTMIDSNTMLPLISIKQEDIASDGLIHFGGVKFERVSISINDLVMLCDAKVNLERLHPVHGIKTESETISSASNDEFDNNAAEMCDYHDPEPFIKTEMADDVSIDESLAKIKIEDVSPVKMEVSDESFNERNFSWNVECQPCFSAKKIEQMSAMKITNALSALSNDSLLAFYDACPDVPMEEIAENGIVHKIPDASNDAFNVYPVNSGSSLNSSRNSWPVSDESGIFMSDDSANFNELSGKFIANSTFNCPVVGNEVPVHSVDKTHG